MPATMPQPEVMAPEAPRRVDPSRVEAVHLFHDELILPIRGWCSARADRISDCHLVMRRGEIVVYIIQREQRFDFALMRELSTLTMQLIERDWPVDTKLLPACTPDELTAFIDPRQTVLSFRV